MRRTRQEKVKARKKCGTRLVLKYLVARILQTFFECLFSLFLSHLQKVTPNRNGENAGNVYSP